MDSKYIPILDTIKDHIGYNWFKILKNACIKATKYDKLMKNLTK